MVTNQINLFLEIFCCIHIIIFLARRPATGSPAHLSGKLKRGDVITGVSAPPSSSS